MKVTAKRFREYSDARLSGQEQLAIINQLDIFRSIARSVFETGPGYTIDGLAEACSDIVLTCFHMPKDDSIRWREILTDLYEEHVQKMVEDKNYRHEKVCCRKCKKTVERCEMQSGILKKGLPSVYIISIQYLFLCIECVDELTHQFYDRYFSCDLCQERYAIDAAYTSQAVQMHVPEKIRQQICGSCLVIPHIIDECKRLEAHVIRTQKVGLPSTLTLKQWLDTLDHFDWRCAYCCETFQELEHYQAVAIGGGTTIDNCIPSCKRCNLHKKNRHPNTLDRVFPAENLARIREYLASQRKEAA